jgi:hypothetical protein
MSWGVGLSGDLPDEMLNFVILDYTLGVRSLPTQSKTLLTKRTQYFRHIFVSVSSDFEIASKSHPVWNERTSYIGHKSGKGGRE